MNTLESDESRSEYGKGREKHLLLLVLILAIIGIGAIYMIESNKKYNIVDISKIQPTTTTITVAVTTTTVPVIATTTTVPTTVIITTTTTIIGTSAVTSTTEISTTTTIRKNPMLERFSGKGYRLVTIRADLYCPSCVEGLTYLLKSKSGVISTDVNYFNDLAKIIYDPKKITKEEVATLVGSVGDAVIVDDVEI